MHFLIEESADTGRSKSQCFRRQIEALPDRAGFEMHVPIATLAIKADSAIQISNQGECHTGVAGQLLSETEPGRDDALIPGLDSLQLRCLGPVSIHPGGQSLHLMDIEVQRNKTGRGEIGRESRSNGTQNGRELWQRHRYIAYKVQS